MDERTLARIDFAHQQLTDALSDVDADLGIKYVYRAWDMLGAALREARQHPDMVGIFANRETAATVAALEDDDELHAQAVRRALLGWQEYGHLGEEVAKQTAGDYLREWVQTDRECRFARELIGSLQRVVWTEVVDALITDDEGNRAS